VLVLCWLAGVIEANASGVFAFRPKLTSNLGTHPVWMGAVVRKKTLSE